MGGRVVKSHGQRPFITARPAIVLAIVFALATSQGCGARTSPAERPVRIGYQKWGTCSLLKASGRLAAGLGPEGRPIEWIEFPAGPPLLEALHAGSIDFGHTGDSPPIFAQAAGVPLRYVGASTPCPEGSGIVVRKDSPLRALEDLRGRRVAFTKGSSAHTMLLRSLSTVGITLDDIEPSYLSSADFLAQHRGALRELLRELEELKRWAKEHPDETAKLLSREVGIEAAVLERAERRQGRYGVETDAGAIMVEQQRLADDYLRLGLLPRSIDVRTAFHFITPDPRLSGD